MFEDYRTKVEFYKSFRTVTSEPLLLTSKTIIFPHLIMAGDATVA